MIAVQMMYFMIACTAWHLKKNGGKERTLIFISVSTGPDLNLKEIKIKTRKKR